MQAIVHLIREIVSFSPLFGQQINLILHPQQNIVDNPIYLCDLVATLVQGAETEDLQLIMQETDVGLLLFQLYFYNLVKIRKRLDHTLLILQKEKSIAELKHTITKDVEKKVHDTHRKYMLTEQV